MPYKSFPFDSTFTGVDSNGIPQGDRGATSVDWAEYVSRMFTDGYFRLLDGQLTPSISAIPMAIDIAAGSAMIKGRQYSQDDTIVVSLGLSDSLPRIDRIVLRMSTEAEDRNISIKVLKGTPAASPVAPALTCTASVYDLCLAQISVGANAIQLIADNLTDTRNDDALCGYVKILLDGRYYPNGSISELLWVYTMFPGTLTPEQKSVIESNTELNSIYDASRIADTSQRFTLFRSSGNFTVPTTGLYKVTVVGGGGGGEGIYSPAYGLVSGGAGGGGGCAIKWISLTKGAVVPVTIGAGGFGGTGASSASGYKPGGNGGTSSFGVYCSATGGNGGMTYSSEQLTMTGIGGLGTGGDINIKGGQGGILANATESSGYANPYYRAGGMALRGGDSSLGRGAGTPYVSDGSDGATATDIGGGGSPPLVKNSASRPGGNGAAGAVLIEYIRSI